MSIWKSPIFYFGIFLVLAVGAAMAAPFVVNWNQYRDNLEGYGRKISGRDVAISGSISARLFPWPRLVMQDVSIGNPKGFDAAPVLNAKSIEVELALSGLFNGEIRVESVTLEAPVVNLTRQTDGHGNWMFVPDQVLRNSKLMDKVKLDQIKISKGVLYFKDVARNFSAKLTDIDAVLSANALEGPWRLRGTAVQNDRPLELTINTNELKEGEALKFNFKIVPTDGSLPAMVFEGEQTQGDVQGKLRIEPVTKEDEKGSLNRYFDSLVLQADVKTNFNALALTNIHIVPADIKDSSTLIEGDADIAFENGVQAKIQLNSPRLDLDNLVGAPSLRVWQAGGVMALLNNVMKDFPEKFDLNANLDVAKLSAAGESLENVHLVSTAEQNAIRISDLTANLPGRSRMKFSGLIFPNAAEAELGGNLAFESNDTRAFVNWLWPEGKAGLGKIWTGSRGRLKVQSDMTWSGKRFGFQNLNYELDSEAGSADLAVRLGNLPAIDLKVKASSFDLDSYLGEKSNFDIAMFSSLQTDAGLEKRLKFDAQKLRLNGVEANGVAIDFASSLGGFEVKQFEITSIEGAHLFGQGLVLQDAEGPTGDLKLNLKAENPRGLLKLIGAIPKDSNPPWTKVLGATTMQGSVAVRPGPAVPIVTYEIAGQTGSLSLNAIGDIKDVSDATIYGVSSELTAQEGTELLNLFGLQSAIKSGKEGKLVVTATGSPEVGFKTVLAVELLNAKLDYNGNISFGEPVPSLKGQLKLVAPDATDLSAAIGMPISRNLASPLHVFANLTPQQNGISFDDLLINLGQDKISGQLSVSPQGGVSADIAVPYLDFNNVVAASFLPWRGQTARFDSAFADFVKTAPKSEIWLRSERLEIGLGAELKEAVIGVALGAETRVISLASRGADGEPFKLELGLQPRGTSFQLSGTGRGSIDLGKNLLLQSGKSIADGTVILDGHFSGDGRSLEAALAGLNGEGNYVMRDAKLNAISPHGFFKKLESIDNAGALQSAFDGLMEGQGLELSAEQLPIKITEGAISIQPLVVANDETKIIVQPNFDLLNREFHGIITMGSEQNKGLPELAVIYSGVPKQLVRRVDTAALSSKLGFAIIAKDIAELDRVQTEQNKLVADGEAQRQADETKFMAFQAQRNELRLRQRELRVHAAQRELKAATFKTELDRSIVAGQALKKLEIENQLRLLKSR
jgi:AsmA family/AsmA-like C-terminal region